MSPDTDNGTGKPSNETPQMAVEYHIPWWERVIKPGESKKRSSAADAMKEPLARNIRPPFQGHDTASFNSQADSAHLLPGPDGDVSLVIESPAQIDHHPRQTTTTPRIDESPIRAHYSGLVKKPCSTASLWANYPSHLFEERNGPATLKDQVTTHDFAVGVADSRGKVGRVHDQQSVAVTENDLANRSALQGKFGRVFRSSFSKLIPLLDPKHHTTERVVSDLSIAAGNFMPKDDTPTESNIQSRSCSGLLEGTSGHFLTILRSTEPLAHEKCAPKVLNIACAVGGVPEPQTRLISTKSCSESTLPKYGAARIYDAARQIPRVGGPGLLGLRPIMSDYSLQHSMEDSRTSEENIYRRSFTCPGWRQVSDELIAPQEDVEQPA